jgi:hypothetical protein
MFSKQQMAFSQQFAQTLLTTHHPSSCDELIGIVHSIKPQMMLIKLLFAVIPSASKRSLTRAHSGGIASY